MLKFSKALMVLFTFVWASLSPADGRVEGKVTLLQVGDGWTSSGVYVLVTMDSEVNDQPPCATNSRMAIDPATEVGKAMYSALLSAKLAQTQVELIGDDSCNVMGSKFEGIRYLRLK